MDLIIQQNAKHNVYSQPVLKKLLRERWYNIVYYEIAYVNYLSGDSSDAKKYMKDEGKIKE